MSSSSPNCRTRSLTRHVASARGRSLASTRWLARQLNDPFVAEARMRGYPSRSAFKLLALNERFSLIKPGAHVLDLGSARGGWSYIACELAGSKGRVIAVDHEADAIQNVKTSHCLSFVCADVTEPQLAGRLHLYLERLADLVLSDLAPKMTGQRVVDQARTEALAESAALLAADLLIRGGHFVAKMLESGCKTRLPAALKQAFRYVHRVKPPASRAESSEVYIVALKLHDPAALKVLAL